MPSPTILSSTKSDMMIIVNLSNYEQGQPSNEVCSFELCPFELIFSASNKNISHKNVVNQENLTLIGFSITNR